MKKKLLHYINIFLVLLCMLTIFLFSCESASKSSERTNEFIDTVINVSKSENTNAVVETGDNINYFLIVRKCAHFLEFFLLGFLVINLLKDYKKLNIKIVLIGIVFCLLYAISDEVHQLFVDGRSAQVMDVFIDTSGSTLGSLLYFYIYRKSRVIKE